MSYTSKQVAQEPQRIESGANKVVSPKFADQRASTSVQLKQQEMMGAVQRAGMEEEEPLQGKFATVQRAEDEELLQGKFETTQLAEEEELLQGKFETAQLMEEEEPLQGKFNALQRMENEETLQGKFGQKKTTKREEKSNNTGLPDQLKSGIESLSGMSMDHVKVNYNSDKPAQLNAHAYAQGSDIHVAPGQEKHLPHEAWHVVQQAQGRVKPTMQMKAGVPVNDDVGLETEADVMGAKALQLNTSSKETVSGQELYRSDAAVTAQMKRGKNRGKKQKDKIREKGERPAPLPGRSKRLRQEQENDLNAIHGAVTRRKQHQAHLNKLATADRNIKAQEYIHGIRRWKKKEAARLSTLSEKRALMIIEIQDLDYDGEQFADAKSKGGISTWARRNRERFDLWKTAFNLTYQTLIEAKPAEFIDEVKSTLQPEPENEEELILVEAAYVDLDKRCTEIKNLAEKYKAQLDFIGDKWALTKGRRVARPSASSQVSGLTKEYPLGAANVIPHIHHYGTSYHLKIVDPNRDNQLKRYNFVKDGKRDGQADDALAAATGKPEVLRVLNAILNLY